MSPPLNSKFSIVELDRTPIALSQMKKHCLQSKVREGPDFVAVVGLAIVAAATRN